MWLMRETGFAFIVRAGVAFRPLARVAERQTRRIQVPVPARV